MDLIKREIINDLDSNLRTFLNSDTFEFFSHDELKNILNNLRQKRLNILKEKLKEYIKEDNSLDGFKGEKDGFNFEISLTENGMFQCDYDNDNGVYAEIKTNTLLFDNVISISDFIENNL